MLLALLTLPLALAQSGPGRTPTSPLEREIQRELASIRSENQDMRELARAPRSSAVIDQIQRKSLQIDQRLDRIAQLTARLARRPAPGPPPPPAPPVGPIPADPADFAVALGAVKGESFPDQRLQRLIDVASARHFTVAQVVQLLEAFTFPDKKVEAAVLLYPHTVDAQNWFQVYDCFDFPSHRDEVRQRLGL